MSIQIGNTAASTVFIDLATFTELEGYLYGGCNAVTYFVSSVQKANWQSIIPIPLRMTEADFGLNQTYATVNRSGDYVLSVFFSVTIPAIILPSGIVAPPVPAGEVFADAGIKWTKFLGHNLFTYVSITFNELVVMEFGPNWFDVNYEFNVSASKKVGYQAMIGNIPSLYTFVPPGTPLPPSGTGTLIQVPIPFFFGEDSGVALPIAALPFNEVKINLKFQTLQNLVYVNTGSLAVGSPSGGAGTGIAGNFNNIVVNGTTTTAPSMINPQMFGMYSVVQNEERIKMGDAPRDILIHQVQTAAFAAFKDITSPVTFDLRFNHPVIAFFFMAQNTSSIGELSNYTTAPNYAGVDPINDATLYYDSTVRLSMYSAFYSLYIPWLLSRATPEDIGFHMWSYSLFPWKSATPAGSTNFSKLSNISIFYDMTQAAINAAGLGPGGIPVDQNNQPITLPNSIALAPASLPFAQKWSHVFLVKNWSIIKVSNGSISQPIM
jgi:hypothetical protein